MGDNRSFGYGVQMSHSRIGMIFDFDSTEIGKRNGKLHYISWTGGSHRRKWIRRPGHYDHQLAKDVWVPGSEHYVIEDAYSHVYTYVDAHSGMSTEGCPYTLINFMVKGADPFYPVVAPVAVVTGKLLFTRQRSKIVGSGAIAHMQYPDTEMYVVANQEDIVFSYNYSSPTNNVFAIYLRQDVALKAWDMPN